MCVAQVRLTVLSEVAANGVTTLFSVSGEGMELCEKAMTTLLQGYIMEKAPTEWKGLFKDAVNIGFMIKYMFRESLPMAKDLFVKSAAPVTGWLAKFTAAVPAEVQTMITQVLDDTILTYGDVGLYDPGKLAEIDFLNQPKLLVPLRTTHSALPHTVHLPRGALLIWCATCGYRSSSSPPVCY